MDVSKCSDYPILFQPYTLRISVSNLEEHAMLASIFMNAEIIAKAWKKITIKQKRNIFLIGNAELLEKQLKKLKIHLPLIKVETFSEIKNEQKNNLTLLKQSKLNNLQKMLPELLNLMEPTKMQKLMQKRRFR